ETARGVVVAQRGKLLGERQETGRAGTLACRLHRVDGRRRRGLGLGGAHGLGRRRTLLDDRLGLGRRNGTLLDDGLGRRRRQLLDDARRRRRRGRRRLPLEDETRETFRHFLDGRGIALRYGQHGHEQREHDERAQGAAENALETPVFPDVRGPRQLVDAV